MYKISQSVPGTAEQPLQPQTIQSASEDQKIKIDSESAATALLSCMIAEDKERCDNNNRQQIMSDFETFQKSRVNYMTTTRNTMFEKIVKLMDQPKSPSESPDPEGSPTYAKMMSTAGNFYKKIYGKYFYEFIRSNVFLVGKLV